MSTEIVDKKLKSEWTHHSKVVDDGMVQFIYIGHSLAAIQSGKLYLAEGYTTFEQCCLARWNLKLSRVYQIMSSAGVVEELRQEAADQKLPLPSTESHAAALLKGADDADDRRKLWKAAVAKSEEIDKPITAKMVSDLADELFPKPDSFKPPQDPGKQPAVQVHQDGQPDETEASSEDSDEPVYTGVPSGGTSFEPVEFDAACQPDAETDAIIWAKHLAHLAPSLKAAQSFQREISNLKSRVMAWAETQGGSFLHVQDTQRLCDQLRANIKFAAFECNCPQCKNRPVKTCPRCGGRGFLSHGQALNLTVEERKWLESQSAVEAA